MKHYRIYLVIVLLVLASLACNALSRGSGNVPATPPPSDSTVPDATQPATDNNNTDNTVKSDFPMTSDAYNVMEAGGSLVFYTKMSAEDVMKFYRDTYTSKGYTERKELTIVSGTTFSMVFDGDPSGKSVVIQSVDLGDGSRTVAIRLEKV